MRTRRESFPARAVTTLLVAFLATVVGNASQRYNAPVVGNASERYIDLTFSARGEASTVESVTVTNLTHTDIPAVTLNGTATLRLNNLDATFDTGDVNGDGSVDVADIATIISVMANGSAGDSPAQADVNGDGTVDVADIASVISIMASKSRSAKMFNAQRNVQSSIFNVQSTNAVTMDFHPGDILRFEGTSGEMRTIMHLSPESSHPVTLDFFRCEDKDGYNYPIVRIGDMLWMMEDLRPQTMTNLIKTSKPSIWKNVTESDSALFVTNGRAYYNVPGARKAMPAGWEMPSIDEMYALVKEMDADTLLWGDFLKDRTGYEWDNTSDIGSLRVYSQGHVDEEPVFTKALGSKSLFCDVKVGNMSNSDLPEIAVLTRGLRTDANQMLEQQGYLYVSRLRYDDNLKLTESIILAKTEVNAFASSDALCRHVGNMDLAFGFFRGREYTQDLEVSVAGGIATEHEVTMGSGQEYAVTDQHSVVMQATPFDTYRYEIFGSDDPDEEGMEFVVSMPRERAFVLMTLSKYVRLMASQKNVARPQRFLTSTPGNPWSYPANYDNEIKFVDDAHPFLKGKDMSQGYTNEQVPEGTGNSATRSLSMATSDSKTKSVSLEVEMELVATVGGAKAGVGFNYGHTKENTHTIGQEFSVGGTVSGVPDDDNSYKRFRWNVVWYYVKDAGGIYPVVNYIVTR